MDVVTESAQDPVTKIFDKLGHLAKLWKQGQKYLGEIDTFQSEARLQGSPLMQHFIVMQILWSTEMSFAS